MKKTEINLPALLAAVAAFFFLLFFPVFDSVPASQAFAMLIMVAILWMTEAIPISLTGLMIPIVACFLQLATPKDAFREFAHPIIFLFMGGFVLAGALSRHGLDKLLADKLIALARGNFYKSAVLMMLATAMISCWVSNTSTTAMMLPLAMGMLVLGKKDAVSSESKFLLLGIAYSANIGGILSVIGSPPNAIGAAIMKMSFSEWLVYSIPVFLITFPAMVIVMTMYFKPDRKLSIGKIILEDRQQTEAPNKILIAIFGFSILLWLLESIIAPALNINDSFSSLVAVIAIFLMMLFKIMNWKEIISSIQWEVLLLFGGGLTLGMLIEKSGLGIRMVQQVMDLIITLPLIGFLFIIIMFSIVLTEFMSNTASAALFLPLLYTIAVQLKIPPVLILFPATVSASYGFMLPAGPRPTHLFIQPDLFPYEVC